MRPARMRPALRGPKPAQPVSLQGNLVGNRRDNLFAVPQANLVDSLLGNRHDSLLDVRRDSLQNSQ